jgi:hypothetical protein
LITGEASVNPGNVPDIPRRSARPRPERTIELTTSIRDCPECGRKLWAANKPSRVVVTLENLIRPRMQVRSGRKTAGRRYKACLRPEEEGRFALPQQEFGLDIIALAGRRRHGGPRSVPVIHAELARRGLDTCVRSVGNLVDRHAKVQLKKKVRSYCAAVRPALTDDGRPPLEASGLKLQGRLWGILPKGLEATSDAWPEPRRQTSCGAQCTSHTT